MDNNICVILHVVWWLTNIAVTSVVDINVVVVAPFEFISNAWTTFTLSVIITQKTLPSELTLYRKLFNM